MKNWIATSFCARCSAVSESRREPVKRQTMTADAMPSMNDARPQPTSAIEPAATPARRRPRPRRPCRTGSPTRARPPCGRRAPRRRRGPEPASPQARSLPSAARGRSLRSHDHVASRAVSTSPGRGPRRLAAGRDPRSLVRATMVGLRSGEAVCGVGDHQLETLLGRVPSNAAIRRPPPSSPRTVDRLLEGCRAEAAARDRRALRHVADAEAAEAGAAPRVPREEHVGDGRPHRLLEGRQRSGGLIGTAIQGLLRRRFRSRISSPDHTSAEQGVRARTGPRRSRTPRACACRAEDWRRRGRTRGLGRHR